MKTLWTDFKNLKWKTKYSFITFIFITIGIIFAFGRWIEMKKTAVQLNKPFSLRIIIEHKPYTFDKVLIAEKPNTNLIEGKIILMIRDIKNPFEIREFGAIQVEKMDIPFWRGFSAYAEKENIEEDIRPGIEESKKENFDFYCHRHDNDFTEQDLLEVSTKNKEVRRYLVFRTYKDGDQLRYRMILKKEKNGLEYRVVKKDSFQWLILNVDCKNK